MTEDTAKQMMEAHETQQRIIVALEGTIAHLRDELESVRTEARRESSSLFDTASKAADEVIRLRATIKELQAAGKCLCGCDACKYCEQLLEDTNG